MTGRWYWLSFADPDLPKGRQFLGAAIVFADPDERKPSLLEMACSEPWTQEQDEVAAAIQVAHDRDCNPGGEVRVVSMPYEVVVTDQYQYRLMNREEAESLDIDTWGYCH